MTVMVPLLLVAKVAEASTAYPTEFVAPPGVLNEIIEAFADNAADAINIKIMTEDLSIL